jgi:uncharacterized lipoprotein YddW (UPF0748 family)
MRSAFEKHIRRRVTDWPRSVKKGGALHGQFTAFRAQVITDFVRSVRSELRRSHPGTVLSAAVYTEYPQCVSTVGQDWARWVREGLVDFVCPMNYSEDPSHFDGLLRRQVAAARSPSKIVTGIGVSSGESSLTPDRVIHQVELARRRGVRGFCLFDLDAQLEDSVLPLLGASVRRP